MKKIAILLSVFITILGIYSFKPTSEEVKWMSFNDGYSLAKKKNKINGILLLIPCRNMHANIVINILVQTNLENR